MGGIRSFPVTSQNICTLLCIRKFPLILGFPGKWNMILQLNTAIQNIYILILMHFVLCFINSFSIFFLCFLFFWNMFLSTWHFNFFNPSGLRPAAGGARSANGPPPSHVPGRWHSSTTAGARATNESFEDGGVSWRWQTLMAFGCLDYWLGKWGEGVLYGIFKETFMGVYMYILYNKGPIEVYIYVLWLSLWYMVMDVTEEEAVFLNILW